MFEVEGKAHFLHYEHPITIKSLKGVQFNMPAISNNAASITAAPLSMVAINISWPGQSTKETCLFDTN